MIQFDNCVDRFRKMILHELKDQGIKCWLAGGALRNYFCADPNETDFDLFFPDEANYEKCATYMKDGDADIKWESNNGMKLKYELHTYDLVKKFFPGPQETINEFDFTVSMIAVDCDKVYHGESSFIDLAKKQLMINKLPFPASTLKRSFRYYKKGFYMCDGEMKKLIEAIQNMPKKQQPVIPVDAENKEEDEGSGDSVFAGFD